MMLSTVRHIHPSNQEISESLAELLLWGPRGRPPIGGPYHPNAVIKKEAETQERVRRVRQLMNIRQAQKDVTAMERRLEAARESLTTMQRDVGAAGAQALAQFKSPAAPVLPAFLESRRRELLASRGDTVNVVTVRTASSREVTSITMTSRPMSSSSSTSSSDLLSRRRGRAIADAGRVKVRVLSASSSSGKSSGSSSRRQRRASRRPLEALEKESSPLFLWNTRDEVSGASDKTLVEPGTPGTPYYDSESGPLPGMTSLDTLLPSPLTLRLPTTRSRLAGCRSPASPR
ncbi:Gag-Pol polyprotein [Frankliniella fusca]|uniref:Gag-Pol polyprotein n=1 Tax=Frankliniella fusca TaxID=407009 RepID=A0AAE1LBG5_9NEOP|nr:Gag-Pol polyprotein [Frankliniella fusca]